MSTGAKVVLVLGGLAVVGAGAAYAAGLFNTNSSSGGSSDACLTGLQANVTALNSFQTTCNQAFSAVNFTGACLTEFQSMANTFSSTCATCNGTSGYSGAVQDWQSDIIDYGSVHGVNETGGSCH
jgi:hypothetical protein